jgi:hypothetical protein
MFVFIRGNQEAEIEADAVWSKIELNSFLLSYFAWWTEGDGRSTTEKVVAECEQFLVLHLKSVEAFAARAGNFGCALSYFQDAVNNLPSEEK